MNFVNYLEGVSLFCDWFSTGQYLVRLGLGKGLCLELWLDSGMC